MFKGVFLYKISILKQLWFSISQKHIYPLLRLVLTNKNVQNFDIRHLFSFNHLIILKDHQRPISKSYKTNILVQFHIPTWLILGILVKFCCLELIRLASRRGGKLIDRTLACHCENIHKSIFSTFDLETSNFVKFWFFLWIFWFFCFIKNLLREFRAYFQLLTEGW
jgi:hypothetical protein